MSEQKPVTAQQIIEEAAQQINNATAAIQSTVPMSMREIVTAFNRIINLNSQQEQKIKDLNAMLNSMREKYEKPAPAIAPDKIVPLPKKKRK